MPSENRAKILHMSASSSAPDRPVQQTAGELPPAVSPRYSRAQLAQHNGSDPNLPILIAYKGKVYDVTASYPWAKGSHWGAHRAGQDLTGCLRRQSTGKKCYYASPVSANSTGLEAGRQFDDLSIPVSKHKHVGLLSRELDQLFLPYLRWTSH
jgi:predicted heme/steroid binding protein